MVGNIDLGAAPHQKLEVTYEDDSRFRRAGFAVVLASLGLGVAGTIVGGIVKSNGSDVGTPLMAGSIGAGFVGMLVGTGLLLNYDDGTFKVSSGSPRATPGR